MDPLTPQPASSPPVDHEGKWVLIAVIGLGALFLYWLDPGRWLSLDAVQAQREALWTWTAAHYPLAVAVFITLYCLQTALSFPGATLLTLLGGFLFGPLPGALYVNLGATSGATLAFLSARYLFRDTVERKFGSRLRTIQEGFARDGFNYLLMLRLVPLFPFFLVNLLAGLTRLRTRTFMAATSLGILPASLVYSYAGRQLGSLSTVSDIASGRVLTAFALLGLLALAPVAYRRWKG